MIEINPEHSETERSFVLYINGFRKGKISKTLAFGIRFHWEIYGPVNIENVEELTKGIAELVAYVPKLEKKHVDSIQTSRRRRAIHKDRRDKKRRRIREDQLG